MTDGVTTTLSAIIVSFSDPDATRGAVESLLAQSHPPIEVLVVDNHPDARTAKRDERLAAGRSRSARSLRREPRLHRGAATWRPRRREGSWLFFLNPDARADPACLATLLEAVGPRCGVAGAQVLLPDSRTNAGDNPVHITGIAWSGRFGEPRENGLPREVGSVSGAALLARAEAFRQAGGMCERLFMYEDDVDLCWRVRLTGWTVVFCPDAIVLARVRVRQGNDEVVLARAKPPVDCALQLLGAHAGVAGPAAARHRADGHRSGHPRPVDGQAASRLGLAGASVCRN